MIRCLDRKDFNLRVWLIMIALMVPSAKTGQRIRFIAPPPGFHSHIEL